MWTWAELSERLLPQKAIYKVFDTEVPDEVRDTIHNCKATLPPNLHFRDTVCLGEEVQGVFATECIPKGTRFGKMIGNIVHPNYVTKGPYTTQIVDIHSGKTLHYIDCNDRRRSNWMRQVMPAFRNNAWNLLAYQTEQNEVFYLTIRNILPGEELCVWYCKEFADRIDEYLSGQMFAEAYRKKDEQNEATKAIQQVMQTLNTAKVQQNGDMNPIDNEKRYDNTESYNESRLHFNANYIKREDSYKHSNVICHREMPNNERISSEQQNSQTNGFNRHEKVQQHQLSQELLPTIRSTHHQGQLQHPPSQPRRLSPNSDSGYTSSPTDSRSPTNHESRLGSITPPIQNGSRSDGSEFNQRIRNDASPSSYGNYYRYNKMKIHRASASNTSSEGSNLTNPSPRTTPSPTLNIAGCDSRNSRERSYSPAETPISSEQISSNYAASEPARYSLSPSVSPPVLKKQGPTEFKVIEQSPRSENDLHRINESNVCSSFSSKSNIQSEIPISTIHTPSSSTVQISTQNNAIMSTLPSFKTENCEIRTSHPPTTVSSLTPHHDIKIQAEPSLTITSVPAANSRHVPLPNKPLIINPLPFNPLNIKPFSQVTGIQQPATPQHSELQSSKTNFEPSQNAKMLLSVSPRATTNLSQLSPSKPLNLSSTPYSMSQDMPTTCSTNSLPLATVPNAARINNPNFLVRNTISVNSSLDVSKKDAIAPNDYPVGILQSRLSSLQPQKPHEPTINNISVPLNTDLNRQNGIVQLNNSIFAPTSNVVVKQETIDEPSFPTLEDATKKSKKIRLQGAKSTGTKNFVKNESTKQASIGDKRGRGYRSLPYPLTKVDGKIVYKCEYCEKVFGQLSNLKVHLRTHTGDRPFKCEQCPKAFTQLAHLQKHDLVHSGKI